MAHSSRRPMDRAQVSRHVAELDDTTLRVILAGQPQEVLINLKIFMNVARYQALVAPFLDAKIHAPSRAGASQNSSGLDRVMAPFADAVARAAAFHQDEPLAIRTLDVVGKLFGHVEMHKNPSKTKFVANKQKT